ncbi:MAG: sigma 54-interacting transcriptional regulator [Candidatus Eisenbacteria bacterium]
MARSSSTRWGRCDPDPGQAAPLSRDPGVQAGRGSSDIHVDLRVVAATNVDLAQRIEDSQFRKDLFYRLGVVSIELPPLRERGDDVCLLAEHFLRRFTDELQQAVHGHRGLGARGVPSYAWPGNVRELRNLIERIVLIEDDTVLRLAHLPDDLRDASGMVQARWRTFW